MPTDPLQFIAQYIDVAQLEKVTDRIKRYAKQPASPSVLSAQQQCDSSQNTNYSTSWLPPPLEPDSPTNAHSATPMPAGVEQYTYYLAQNTNYEAASSPGENPPPTVPGGPAYAYSVSPMPAGANVPYASSTAPEYPQYAPYSATTLVPPESPSSYEYASNAVPENPPYAYSVTPVPEPHHAYVPTTPAPSCPVATPAAAPNYAPALTPASPAATPQTATLSSSPTIIAPHCIAGRQTKLFLKEKKFSLTGDDASVKDSNRNTIFKVHANFLSFSERRHLSDSQGRTIGQLRKKRFPAFQPTVYIGTPTDETKIKVKAVGVFDPFHCDAKIYAGGAAVGRVKGNWRAKKFSVVVGGSEVATASRKTTAASLFLDADSYCIDIQPGTDTAFVTLLVLALDELYHDED